LRLGVQSPGGGAPARRTRVHVALSPDAHRGAAGSRPEARRLEAEHRGRDQSGQGPGRPPGLTRPQLLALIVGYAIAVAAASCWVARGLKGPSDFLMGHRGLGVPHGIGLFGGIFLAATAVGIVGQGYQRGIAGAALDVALGVGFGVLGLTLLDRMRASPHASLAALLRAHYGPWPGAIGMVLIAGSWLVMLSGFLAAAGVALGQLSGWSYATSIAVAVVILLLYAMPGGMRAVTATNFAHLTALAVLIGALCVLAAGHAATAVPARHGSSSISYAVGLLLISAPTTIVAPDVMMGMSSLR